MTTLETELLAPAGSPEALDAAIGEGADAVYLGLKDFNARMRSANFTYSQFEGALRSLHRMGRKLYVTVNTVFEQREADRVYQLLKYLAALGPDGILVQDFGIVKMVQDNFPSLKLHASTQMNVASARGVNLLSRNGFSRAVLARELSLDEIRNIRANTNMELEIFVHGALCMSVSGLCLFSSYLGGKSANRGMCTQACRRFYTSHSGKGPEDTGEENGGYYFSPADMELIEKIPDLVTAGINSFKIEGRMKSAEYVGTVVSAYRLVMDNLDSGEESLNRAIADARLILKNDFARSKTMYLIDESGNTGIDWLNPKQNGGTGIPGNTGIDWLNPKQSGGTGIPLGKLLRVKARGEEPLGLIRPAGPDPEDSPEAIRPRSAPSWTIAPAAGDSVRLHKADDSDRVSRKLTFVDTEPDGGIWISIPEGFGPGDSVYLIQTKAMTRRYTPVIPRRLEDFKRTPGRDKAPLPLTEFQRPLESRKPPAGFQRSKTAAPERNPRGSGRNKDTALAPGFYAAVSRIEDLYVLQSSRPVKAILPYSRKLVHQLLGSRSQALPFPARDIILSLDPFFPQAGEAELADAIPALMEKGFAAFIVNNPGHFSLFRITGETKSGQDKTVLIAGPWLYTFNIWAWDFIARCGAEYCVSPFENNRQNLERTFFRAEPSAGRRQDLRSRVFITIFSRPSLFRIRRDLGKFYGFENFTGSKDEAFRLVSGPEGTQVYPWEPFSIVDKTPFLREAGFSRFILDFSSGPLKKAEYRDIMEAADRAAPLPGTNRFNWKNGFFRNENPAQ
ncbi:MAG: U32 family peptidase [Treponema sp.]|nr:U32 family peptidase [Treponema sp.]